MRCNVLLVSSSEKGAAAISSLLSDDKYYPVVTADSVSYAEMLCDAGGYDLIIVNSPLSDDFGAEFAVKKSLEQTCSVIMIANESVVRKLSIKVSRYGVLVTKKPIDKNQFGICLDLAYAMISRYKKLEAQNEELKEKLSEVKLVERAKNVLMECLKMTEPQAHRYLEKQAMDMRVTKKEAASSVIRTYTDSY